LKEEEGMREEEAKSKEQKKKNLGLTWWPGKQIATWIL